MNPARLAAFALLFTLLVACSAKPPHAEEEHEHEQEHEDDHVTLSEEAYAASGITVEPAARRSLDGTIEVAGSLTYDERKMAVATARIGGRIAEVVADYGQAVATGDVLAWIDSPELGPIQAEHRRTLAAFRAREAEYERARLLLEGQAISRGEFLRREADWRSAQLERDAAEQKLRQLGLADDDVERPVYPVRAPRAGRVTERNAAPGQVVSPDETLFVVADLRTLWLFLKIFEKDLPSVALGTSVALSCESHPEDRFAGKIDFVGEILDPHSRTIPARAVIDNAGGKLKPGMFVYAQVESVPEHGGAEPVLAVPTAAVARIDERDMVFVESAERTFEAREVQLGRRTDDWAEVTAGLAEGERVAVGGTFTLKSEVLKGNLAEHHH
jgi:cobalt-zinc-cadmium efflux system membrane fusion protein